MLREQCIGESRRRTNSTGLPDGTCNCANSWIAWARRPGKNDRSKHWSTHWWTRGRLATTDATPDQPLAYTLDLQDPVNRKLTTESRACKKQLWSYLARRMVLVVPGVDYKSKRCERFGYGRAESTALTRKNFPSIPGMQTEWRIEKKAKHKCNENVHVRRQIGQRPCSSRIRWRHLIKKQDIG